MRKIKVIVILGQTATGKSDLAVKIAKKLNGEIISADSRQVYKGLDIGTGKITKKEKCGVPHYLLNVANPKRKFTVVQYKKLAEEKIKEIILNNKVPIICGGTGFYIDAITKGIIFPEVPPNIKLRKILENKNVNELFLMLKKLDIKRAKDIKNKNEQNNKFRIIRSIEIAKTLGKIPKIKQKKPPYQFIKIGLFAESAILKERINIRLIKRFKIGMLNEINNLQKNGLSFKRMEELGLEYRYISKYLQKKISKNEMLETLNKEIYHYAKRQMTWFKRDKNIRWINISKENPEEKDYLKIII